MRLKYLIAVVLLVAGCAQVTPASIPLKANTPIQSSPALTGPQFRAEMDKRFNGTVEIDPVLGTGTALWNLALGAVPAQGFCLGNVTGNWGSLGCATSATAPVVLNSGVVSLGNLSPVTLVTVSGATTLVLPGIPFDPIEILTMTAAATITIPQGAFPGQSLTVEVCQNGTGGFAPIFTPISGLTIVGTFPTFTTTASKCGDFGLIYTTTTQAWLSGSNGGPL